MNNGLENGTDRGKLGQIIDQLSADPRIEVAAITASGFYDGRKDNLYHRTEISVVPTETTVGSLDEITRGLLPDLSGVNRRNASTRINEAGDVIPGQITTFERVDPTRDNEFNLFTVSVLPRDAVAFESNASALETGQC